MWRGRHPGFGGKMKVTIPLKKKKGGKKRFLQDSIFLEGKGEIFLEGKRENRQFDQISERLKKRESER